MFPLNDFNFVACAIATFSAAVGYRYSKKRAERRANLGRSSSDIGSTYRLRKRERSLSSVSSDAATLVDSDESFVSDSPTPTDPGTDVTEPGSLKRKNRDENFNTSNVKPQLLHGPRRSSSPPRKRSRSEPLEGENHERDLTTIKEVEIVNTVVHPESAIMTSEQISISNGKASSEPVPHEEQRSLAHANPKPIASAFTIPVCKPSNAFSAFAGASSGLALSSSATNGLQKPIWCADRVARIDDSKTHTWSESNSPGVLVDNAERSSEPLKSAEVDGSLPNSTEHPLAALTATSTATPKQAPTGEEDEDVQEELKGVKLFIKRGDKDFSSGILGHVKLLTHRKMSDERLVFRRESVWKVSMSVRLRPEVRCTFDEDQGILRVTQKEIVEAKSSDQKCEEEVVIYALKRGKVAKSDFTEFARTVVDSPRLSAGSVSGSFTE